MAFYNKKCYQLITICAKKHAEAIGTAHPCTSKNTHAETLCVHSNEKNLVRMPDFSRGRILAFNGHIRCYESYLLCADMRLNWAAYFFVHKNGIFAVSLWIYAYFFRFASFAKRLFFCFAVFNAAPHYAKYKALPGVFYSIHSITFTKIAHKTIAKKVFYRTNNRCKVQFSLE